MNKQKSYDQIKKEMLSDTSLPLRNGDANLVLGEGNLDTKVVFIGEGPGFWENKLGRPFVGNAGKLLDKLLLSIKLPRNEVFITNVICYRPPGNRDPSPSEIEAFQPYIDRLIETIKPQAIVTLGRFSMRKFLPSAKISSIHGNPYTINWKGRNIYIVPMYHPAAALRNGQVMDMIKEDFQRLPEVINKASKSQTKQLTFV